MIRNPFKYGREVSGDQFYDRNDVFQTLYRRLSDGATNVVMYAPRRYGKTHYLQQLGYFTFESVVAEGRDWVETSDVEAGVVEREKGVYRVGDPFFARYVRSSCVEL